MAKCPPPLPHGLERKPYEGVTINFNPDCSLKWAWEREEEGLVTIRRVRDHWQYIGHKTIKAEYWVTYEITPTEKGLSLIEENEKFWREREDDD